MIVPLDTETREVIVRRCSETLNAAYRGAVSDTLAPLRVLQDAKTITVEVLVERGWESDDAWRRVGKFEINVRPGERGDEYDVTDEWRD